MNLHKLTFVLLVIGGLNWLLVGVLGWDISVWLGGQESVVSRTLYVLVGLSALYEVVTHKSNCKVCSSAPAM